MPKITPCLWFDAQAEAAMQLYVSQFNNSRIVNISRYPAGRSEEHMRGKEGKVINGTFELDGQRFMALDGGDIFKFTPAISFFVNQATEAEVDQLWNGLIEGGMALMPLQQYPFSEKFGWLMDQYGLSWQVNLGARPQKITPMLMFVGKQHGKAEEAMHFYTSLFAHSGITHIERYGTGENGAAGTVKHGLFSLHHQEFMAMDSNLEHDFTFNEALSFYVECETQEEIDHFWYQLSADPSAEQCGWLKDKFGVSWQIVPAIISQLLNDADPAKSKRVMDVLFPMKKLDIATLERAYAG